MAHIAALAGNPNCGKTLLFNILTGSNQKVANFPGITVDQKRGMILGTDIELVDLPGIYSLSPYSQEEKVSRDFILQDRPDFIINIIDGTNIERNMYLTLQLLELQIPMVVVINMVDELERLCIKIDFTALSEKIGVPVIPISAKKKLNIDAVIALLHQFVHSAVPPRPLIYSQALEILKQSVQSQLKQKYSPFVLMKILENDQDVIERCHIPEESMRKIHELISIYLQSHASKDEDTYIADARYTLIEDMLATTLLQERHHNMHKTSDKIDKIVTNRFLAIPIFLGIMLLVFQITFGPFGRFFQDGIDGFLSGFFSDSIAGAMVSSGAPSWIIRLVVEGMIGGVGGIIAFLPQIAILFLLLSLIEDSGYMSRVAFILDKLLQKIGLSGKAFVPLLMGFGCTTPAVMAARTLDNEKDRQMAIMLSPFMSCSARMPIYVLFTGIFFKNHRGIIIFTLYFVGLLVAVLSGLLLKNTLFKGVFSPFVVELPPYRVPHLQSVARQAWEKVYGFLIKAGTIILSMSVVLWLLQNFTIHGVPVKNSAESIIADLGRLVAPLLSPLGFGQWESAVALIAGIVAKEVVVSSMAVLYGGVDFEIALAANFSPLSAFSFMLFSLLYMPCIAAFATIKRELGSYRFAIGTALYQTFVAYLASLLVFQIGRLFL